MGDIKEKFKDKLDTVIVVVIFGIMTIIGVAIIGLDDDKEIEE